MINHGFILLSVQASHEFVAVCGSVLVMCVFKKLQGEARGKLSVLCYERRELISSLSYRLVGSLV